MSNPIITERDLSTLICIGCNGIASLEQLAARYWPDARVETARARLGELVRAGYLYTCCCRKRGKAEIVYALTRQGLGQVPPVLRDQVQDGWPPRGEVVQQLLANDARLVIEQQFAATGATLISWRSAREMRAEHASEVAKARWEGRPLPSREIPDAQIVFHDAGGKQVTIDLEIDGQYYGAMLKGKMQAYGRSRRSIVWVCTSERESRIRDAARAYSNISILVV